MLCKKLSDIGEPTARMSSSRVVLREFLDLYKSLPCLWNMQCKDYANREMKTEAYKLMVRKLSELEPGAHRATVIRKITNIRSNYRKEKRKVEAFQAEGIQYVPTLWYYPLMGFLDGEQDTESGSSDSDSIDIECVKVQLPDSPKQYSNDGDNGCSSVTATELANTEKALPNGHFPTKVDTVALISDESNPRKRKHEEQNHFRMANCEDRHDAFGRSIAFKLRALPDEQRIYAEKLINEALYGAEMGSLSKHCRVQL